ncbi:MAG: hypothetical protein NZ455_07335 [Bacteroidia bacterium]|nr:hypothetical protein [Bacteroidia bacterium]
MGVPLAAQGSGHSARSPKHADLVGFCPQGHAQKIIIVKILTPT